MPVVFSVAEARVLCGGQFPAASGFHWGAVEHFQLEDGILEPYAGDTILPGPGLKVVVEEVPVFPL